MKKKDLQALWSKLTSGVESDEDEIPDDRIAEQLQQSAHPVYQIIHDQGHSTATATNKTKIGDLEGRLQTLEQERDDALQKLNDERGKSPDTEELRRQYEEREQELQRQFETEREELQSELATTRRDNAKQMLKSFLRSGDRVLDSDYADVRVQKPDVDERITFDDEGRLQVLQAGKQIALAPPAGVSPLQLLARELKESAPKKFVEVSGDRGAGSRGNGTGGHGGGSGFFSSYREELQRERESAQPKEGGESAAKERLGIPAQ